MIDDKDLLESIGALGREILLCTDQENQIINHSGSKLDSYKIYLG